MDTINGLPAHILLVHAVVVLLPLAALLLVLTAVWPAARRHLALANAVLSVIVVLLVPVTTSAGEWLERQVDQSALVEDHAELGDTALFVALPVAILALVIWWRGREIDSLPANITAQPPATPTARTGTAAAETDFSAAQPDITAVRGEAPAGVPPMTGGSPAAPSVDTLARPTRRTFLAPESAIVTMVIVALSVVSAGAAIYDTYLIGDSGAKATWQGEISTTTTGDIPAGDDN